MSNRTTFRLIAVLSGFLILLLLKVAIHEQLWREFWFSSAQIVACALCSAYLLRQPQE